MMGIQERAIVEVYREMQAEKHGAKLTPDGLATLAAACITKRAMENCTIKICESLEEIREQLGHIEWSRQ
jgi:hypothetical protein